jgi:hypothetical protein
VGAISDQRLMDDFGIAESNGLKTAGLSGLGPVCHQTYVPFPDGAASFCVASLVRFSNEPINPVGNFRMLNRLPVGFGRLHNSPLTVVSRGWFGPLH